MGRTHGTMIIASDNYPPSKITRQKQRRQPQGRPPFSPSPIIAYNHCCTASTPTLPSDIKSWERVFVAAIGIEREKRNNNVAKTLEDSHPIL